MGKKKAQIQVDLADFVCFICKDGGELRVCDYRNCRKVYHWRCVNQDESFMQATEQWFCGWHKCFICYKGSDYRCIGCPISVCRRCIGEAEFVTVKNGKKGFCINCLKLAILAEENTNIESDARKAVFLNEQSYEYMFKEYWEGVNKEEGLSLEDLHTAETRLKSGENNESGPDSDSDELHEEDLVNEVEGLRAKNRVPPKKGSKKIYKKNYISLGSDMGSEEDDNSKKRQRDSDSDELHEEDLVNEVEGLRAKNRVTPKKRSKKIYKKNYISWSSDEGSEEDDNSRKRQRSKSVSKVISELNHCRSKAPENPNSGYAAIVEKNINSLYLRKDLVLKLLKDPETFESKVAGCFVRVKIDPKDFYKLPNKRYQLGQLTGIKKIPHVYKIGEMSIDVVLCITNMKDTRISMLSNDDIEEDECEDLRQMVKAGTFKRPTMAELDKKIKSMHRDIMSHWIDREISRLQKVIDRANEKGWRDELNESIDKRERLRTPEGRNKLLEEIHSVIEDVQDAAEETPSMDVKGLNVAVLDVPLQEVDVPLQKVEGNEVALTETVGVFEDNEQHNLLDPNKVYPTDMIIDNKQRKLLDVKTSLASIQIEANDVNPKDNIGPGIEIIDLDDDDEDDCNVAGIVPTVTENLVVNEDEKEAETDRVWHYVDASGKLQGPVSKAALRFGTTECFFSENNKVWRSDKSPNEAIVLADLLGLK